MTSDRSHTPARLLVGGLASLVTTLCLLVTGPGSAFAATRWTWQPVPHGTTALNQISCPTTAICFAAAATTGRLAVLATTDGGKVEVSISSAATGRASSNSPQYCEVQGTIAKYIGFEILLPTTTWRERYLQTGCGGLCGMISLSAPQSTGYKPLADGYFIVASDDEGHSGNGISWAANATQRVDFAYVSEHDLALVAKGLATTFYSMAPKFSYFDGCSQGGHETLTEIQRYPHDFNGALAGAPASITTELNSFVHEWVNNVNIDKSDHPIVTTTQTTLVSKAVLEKCAGNVGFVLDFRACEQKFDLDSLKCTGAASSTCLTAAQIAVLQKIYAGPETATGQRLFPDGYAMGSESGWSSFVPSSASATMTRYANMTDWLQYLAFARNIGTAGVENEKFTKTFFVQVEKLAPLWDATNPDLAPFERAGGKLIPWQGEADASIPVNSSLAYYQAVVSAMGGLKATQRFAKYYLLPGVGHCGGGAPDTFAGLSSVVRWTEKGNAPGSLEAAEYSSGGTSGGLPGGGPPSGGPPSRPGGPGSSASRIPSLGASASGSPSRTIELYPYPEIPAYSGHGTVDDASSYKPTLSTALTNVIPWLGRFNTTTIWCNANGVKCTRKT